MRYSRLTNIWTPLLKKKGQKLNMEIFIFLKQLTVAQIMLFVDCIIFILFLYITILNLVEICASIVDNLSVVTDGSEDCLLQMNNNRGSSDNYGFIGNSGNTSNHGGTPGGSPGTPGGFPGPNSSHHTNVQILHEDGSISNGVRNLFIYGTGTARMYMNITRGGGPTQKFFIISSTILADSVSRLITNSINDPGYIRAQIQNMRAV
jgi:hypothetical protein